MMQIQKEPNREKIVLEVVPSDTIKDVKVKIQINSGISPGVQCLIFDGKKLDDDHCLSDYIKEESMLVVDCLDHITVKLLTGDTYYVKYEPSDTIEKLKSKIYKENFLPHDQQRLVWCGLQLVDDHRTLNDYKIMTQSTILLISRLRGGMIADLIIKGITHSFDIYRSDTIEKIKAMIKKNNGIPTNQQHLMFRDIEHGPVSISEKTSFRKISSSLEAARFVFRIVRSLWNLTGTSAAVLPMCLSNFKTIRQFKVPISWLRDFTRSYEKTSFRILRRGPGRWSYHNGLRHPTTWHHLPCFSWKRKTLQQLLPNWMLVTCIKMKVWYL